MNVIQLHDKLLDALMRDQDLDKAQAILADFILLHTSRPIIQAMIPLVEYEANYTAALLQLNVVCDRGRDLFTYGRTFGLWFHAFASMYLEHKVVILHRHDLRTISSLIL